MQGNASAPSATDSLTTGGRKTTDGVTWIRRLTIINLGLIALQPLSAGFLMSGYDHASTAHALVANALQLGAIIQGVSAIVLWRRRRVPPWTAAVGVGLFVVVFIQVGLGYNRDYWLHVPIGVGMIGWLKGQIGKL